MVEYLNYKGQEFPLIYDYYGQSRLKMAHEEALEKDTTLKGNEVIEIMLFCSLEAGHEFLDKPFRIKKKDAEGKEVWKEITKKDVAFMLGVVGPEAVSKKLEKFMPKASEEDSDKKK